MADAYDSWRIRSPQLMDPVLFQKVYCCWSIGLGRQLTAIGRRCGLLDSNESVSIQYLLNGVEKPHITQSGAIDNLLSAKPFLINHGTVLESVCPLTYDLKASNEPLGANVTKFKVSDLIVHEWVQYENLGQFYNAMIRYLNIAPMAVAMPTFGSFQNIGNDIYLPSVEEQNCLSYKTYHVMLLCGIGCENGVRFFELQDSYGEQQGLGGYIKVAMDCRAITHFVEIKDLLCSPINPTKKFKDQFPVDALIYYSHISTKKAQAKMLAAKGIITHDEKDIILRNLDIIHGTVSANTFTWFSDSVDVAMNIELSLIKYIGDVAKKLHRGCGINDQVATDFRIWCRWVIDEISGKIRQLQVVLVKLALNNKALIVPTNRKRAQFLLPQLLLAYVEKFDRDATRYNDCKVRLNVCPLGVGDLVGTYLPIDRLMTAHELGFTEPMRNSIDAVADDDYVMEFVSINSITSKHLSSLGEDWIACEKYGLVTSSSSVTNGCSLMQQMHPHPMEVISKKVARLTGCLNTVLKSSGRPLSYNQDFEDYRESMYSSYRTIVGMIEVSIEFAQNATFNQVEINESLLDADSLYCYLLQKGVSVHSSLDMVEKVVGMCVSSGRKLENLSLEELRVLMGIDVLGDDLRAYLVVENSLGKFISDGSTGPASVDKQLHYWANKLGICANI